MKAHQAWMPMYWGDYLSDTMHLTPEEHGAYLLLIANYWTSGPPPDDDAQLARITRCSPEQWGRVAGTVRAFFRARSGRLLHHRIDAELARATGLIASKKARGKAGANARWRKGLNGKSIPQALLGDAPSPSPSPSTESESSPSSSLNLKDPTGSQERPAPKNGAAHAGQPRKLKTPFKLEALPEDWRAFCKAERPDLDPERTFALMRDYFVGAGKAMVDWTATWRNWVRRERRERPASLFDPNRVEIPERWLKEKAENDARRLADGIKKDVPKITH